MHRFKFWIFDLDGTLTVHQHDFESIRVELGIPRGRLILEYLEELAPQDAQRISTRVERWEHELACDARIAAGVHDTLGHLRAVGAHLGVLTRNTRRNALTTLAAIGLDDCFAPDLVLGRDDAPPKPAPDGITRLLHRRQASVAETIMVGDFRLDLEAGRNAGVTTAHIAPAGAESWPELTDHRFESMSEVAARLAAGMDTD